MKARNFLETPDDGCATGGSEDSFDVIIDVGEHQCEWRFETRRLPLLPPFLPSF